MNYKECKTILRLGMVLFAMTSLPFVLSSCSDDEKYVYVSPAHTVSVSMGGADGGNILTDKGNVLIPDKSSVGHDLTDGITIHHPIITRELKTQMKTEIM